MQINPNSDLPLVQLLEAPTAAVAMRAHVSGLGFGFSQFAVFSVYALAFWYGGQLIRAGEMTFSQVLKVRLVHAVHGTPQCAGAASGHACIYLLSRVRKNAAGVTLPCTLPGVVQEVHACSVEPAVSQTVPACFLNVPDGFLLRIEAIQSLKRSCNLC